jgi:hypothetical protein
MAKVVDFARFRISRGERQLSLLDNRPWEPFLARPRLSEQQVAHRRRMLAHLRAVPAPAAAREGLTANS